MRSQASVWEYPAEIAVLETGEEAAGTSEIEEEVSQVGRYRAQAWIAEGIGSYVPEVIHRFGYLRGVPGEGAP